MDIRYKLKWESGINLIRTFFICFVLVLGSYFFTRDTNHLVILPLENLVEKIKKVLVNPLCAIDMTENVKEAINNNEVDFIEKCLL